MFAESRGIPRPRPFYRKHCPGPRDAGDAAARTRVEAGRGGRAVAPWEGPHRVWGLTAVITEFTLKLLAPGVYQPRLAGPELPQG